MESDEIREALRDADRAEAAPWTDYPPTPRWYPPAVGVWAALLTLAFGLLGDVARMVAILVLVAVEVTFLAWYIRYRGGVMPTGPAPREFRRAIWLFVGALVLVVALTAAVALATSPWLGAAVALVTVTAVVAWYEQAYAEAARRARERLA